MVYHLILQVFKYLSIRIYFLDFPERNVDFVALLLRYSVSSSSRDFFRRLGPALQYEVCLSPAAIICGHVKGLGSQKAQRLEPVGVHLIMHLSLRLDGHLHSLIDSPPLPNEVVWPVPFLAQRGHNRAFSFLSSNY